jgi:Flp pilus assembly protein TadD
MHRLPICASLILAGAIPSTLGQTQSGADPATTGTISSRASTPIRHAAQLINQGDIKEALTELDALAIEHPALPGLEYLRGCASYQQSELGKAETAFTKALAQNAQDRESRQLLGITLYRKGRPADAVPISGGRTRFSRLNERRSQLSPQRLLYRCSALR